MEKNLLKQGLIKVFCGIVLVALLLFIPAGTVNYWQAWLLLGILFIPMIAAGFIFNLLVLAVRNPRKAKSNRHPKGNPAPESPLGSQKAVRNPRKAKSNRLSKENPVPERLSSKPKGG